MKKPAIFLVLIFTLLNHWVLADEALDTVVNGNTRFAFDLYTSLAEENPGNLFFSPYSISMALAMTYAGARHNTAEQMAQVLHFAQEPALFHPVMGQLQQQIEASEPDNDLVLKVANGLWLEQTYPFLEAFLQVVEKNYSAKLKQADFIGQAEATRIEINTWIEKQTQGKIQEVLGPGIVNELTRLILVNAIYFKGNWFYPFKEQNTQSAPFWVTPEAQVEVPMMAQQGNQFNYMANERVQILELPYSGETQDLSMIIVLPKQRNGLAEVEKLLSTEKYTDWLNQLHKQEVTVGLPKFEMTHDFELSETLDTMGMPDAFNGKKADFSGMGGSKDFFIYKILHKALVEVNETGTEAAAVTVPISRTTSLPPPAATFRADHPFLFLIRHRSSGSILFLGRIVNPLDVPPHPSEATLSPDLQLFIPKLYYQTDSGEIRRLWANLKPVPNERNKLLFEVVDYGELNLQ